MLAVLLENFWGFEIHSRRRTDFLKTERESKYPELNSADINLAKANYGGLEDDLS